MATLGFYQLDLHLGKKWNDLYFNSDFLWHFPLYSSSIKCKKKIKQQSALVVRPWMRKQNRI